MNVIWTFQPYLIPMLATVVAVGAVTAVAKCARRVFGNDQTAVIAAPIPLPRGPSQRDSSLEALSNVGEHQVDLSYLQARLSTPFSPEEFSKRRDRAVSSLFNERPTGPTAVLMDSRNFHNIPGTHTVKSPVVGSRAQELEVVKEAMTHVPLLAKLQDAIYEGRFIYLIPPSKKDEADVASRELFLDYISKYSRYECTEKNIVQWCRTGRPGCISNKTRVNDLENPWNTWYVRAIVEERNEVFNEDYGCYLPPYVVAYHELMHVEETPPLSKELIKKENGTEVLTAIKTFILLDIVYKRIHGLDENSTVDYGKFIELDGTRIQLGTFANFYRALEERYRNLALAIISPESLAFLKTGQP